MGFPKICGKPQMVGRKKPRDNQISFRHQEERVIETIQKQQMENL